MRPSILAASIVAIAVGCYADRTWADELEPVQIIEGVGFTDDDGSPAEDLSGISCIPTETSQRFCMLVNDEDRSAQAAVLVGDHLEMRKKFALIGKRSSPATLGDEPTDGNCSEGVGKFKDLDGEAVSYQEPYFYIAGSHGCGRNSNKLRSSSFILARVKVDPAGSLLGDAETTYKLGDVLRDAPTVAPFFTEDLNEENGLNIEGIAVHGDRLVVGLRAPVLDGKAYLVSARLDPLFESSESPADAQVFAFQFGEDTGVRDLASLPDGRLLVLTGPAQEQSNVPSGLFIVDLDRPEGAVKSLGNLAPVSEGGVKGKPEGLTVLEASLDRLRIAVVFDGLSNGGPREYSIPLH